MGGMRPPEGDQAGHGIQRLRAQHGFELVWPTRNASSLHKLKLVLRDQ